MGHPGRTPGSRIFGAGAGWRHVSESDCARGAAFPWMMRAIRGAGKLSGLVSAQSVFMRKEHGIRSEVVSTAILSPPRVQCPHPWSARTYRGRLGGPMGRIPTGTGWQEG